MEINEFSLPAEAEGALPCLAITSLFSVGEKGCKIADPPTFFSDCQTTSKEKICVIPEYLSKELHFCEAHNTINNCASSPWGPSSRLGIAKRLSSSERKILEAAEPVQKP